MTMYITGNPDLESANGPQVRCNEFWPGHRAPCRCQPSLDTAGCQELSVCLGILGPALDDLCLEYCGTQLFTYKSLRTLWTCPNLSSLTLDDAVSVLMQRTSELACNT